MVIVVDPKKFREKFGPALDVMKKYQSVPDVMRGPMDEMSRSKSATVSRSCSIPASLWRGPRNREDHAITG
jgi:hypothetical protein